MGSHHVSVRSKPIEENCIPFILTKTPVIIQNQGTKVRILNNLATFIIKCAFYFAYHDISRPQFKRIKSLSSTRNVPTRSVSRKRLDDLSGNRPHQVRKILVLSHGGTAS